MRKSYVIDSRVFADEFSRCCQEYNNLIIAVAWCGNPNKTLPYKILENFKGKIKVLVGTAFNHTHPDAIEWFLHIGADIRVFKNDAELFHPKVYFFHNKQRYALFVGSSNLTYSGFYTNYECNCLIEGDKSEESSNDIPLLEATLARWYTQDYSFRPTERWLNDYRKHFKRTAYKQKKQGIRTPLILDEEISIASWLQQAGWSIYYSKVVEGLKNKESNGQGFHDVLNAAAENLPTPWTIQYFKDIEKRRIIGGIKQYGWLGHVSASGEFRGILASGTLKQQKTIAEAVNSIAQLNLPIPWSKLKFQLDKLIELGPTMKVWGRLLCIVRPDRYCTVASNSVRQNLSKTLSVAQNKFNSSEGYIQLIKLIHSSPWFNSSKPSNKRQADIWERRVAFIDAIFH